MSSRVEVEAEFESLLPARFEAFGGPGGEVVARSTSTETRRVGLGGLDLHVKRQRYSVTGALRAALRNTFLGRSRAAREFRMLREFRSRAGNDVAPAPVAFGERRSLRLLREAFLATRTVPDAVPLAAGPPSGPAAARALGRFLAALHGAGLSHGSLFARNVLATAGDGFCVVDLDRARAWRATVPEAVRARDLAFLDESVPGASTRDRLRVLASYLGGRPTRGWREAIDEHRAEARRRLARRSRARV